MFTAVDVLPHGNSVHANLQLSYDNTVMWCCGMSAIELPALCA